VTNVNYKDFIAGDPDYSLGSKMQ